MLLRVLEKLRKSTQKGRSKVDILEPFAVMGRSTVDLSSNFSRFGAMSKKHVFLIPPRCAKNQKKSDFEPTWCPKACPRGSRGPWGNPYEHVFCDFFDLDFLKDFQMAFEVCF